MTYILQNHSGCASGRGSESLDATTVRAGVSYWQPTLRQLLNDDVYNDK